MSWPELLKVREKSPVRCCVVGTEEVRLRAIVSSRYFSYAMKKKVRSLPW